MKEASVCATVLCLTLRGSPASTCCSADILAVGWSRAHAYVCRRGCSCSRQQCTRLTLMLWTLLFLARASPPASLRRINNSTLLSPLVLSSWVYGLPLTVYKGMRRAFYAWRNTVRQGQRFTGWKYLQCCNDLIQHKLHNMTDWICFNCIGLTHWNAVN